MSRPHTQGAGTWGCPSHGGARLSRNSGTARSLGLGQSGLSLVPAASAPLSAQQQDMSPKHPLCPQDTTDYVAYVAKDPINQRGDADPQGAEKG